MGNPHAIGNAYHITSDESMTWNQIYETLAEAMDRPLNALHVASDFWQSTERNMILQASFWGIRRVQSCLTTQKSRGCA
mgnify:CR=1 FL=1